MQTDNDIITAAIEDLTHRRDAIELRFRSLEQEREDLSFAIASLERVINGHTPGDSAPHSPRVVVVKEPPSDAVDRVKAGLASAEASGSPALVCVPEPPPAPRPSQTTEARQQRAAGGERLIDRAVAVLRKAGKPLSRFDIAAEMQLQQGQVSSLVTTLGAYARRGELIRRIPNGCFELMPEGAAKIESATSAIPPVTTATAPPKTALLEHDVEQIGHLHRCRRCLETRKAPNLFTAFCKPNQTEIRGAA